MNDQKMDKYRSIEMLRAGVPILALVLLCGGVAQAAEKVADDLLFREMAFIEKLAENGYFTLARDAQKVTKALPGLTQAQIAFLDLVRAKVNVQRILKEEELERRQKLVDESIRFLRTVIDKLPPGSALRVEAEGRVITTYISVGDGYLKEIERLRMDIRGKLVPDTEALEARVGKLLEMARAMYGTAEKGARDVQNLYKDLLYKLDDRIGMTDNQRLRKMYEKVMFTVVEREIAYEQQVATMYVNYGRCYDRTSAERARLYDDGYWFAKDLEEFYNVCFTANYITPMYFIQIAGMKDQPLPEEEGGKPKEIKSLIGHIPEPAKLLTDTFVKLVVGEHANKTVRFGQGARPKCFYFFAQSWYRLAKGAYAQADANEAEAERWAAQAETFVASCEKALVEIAEGADRSLVGPIPEFIRKTAQLEVRVPLLLLKAERAHRRGKTDSVAELLVQAKTVCDTFVLSPDQTWAESAKKRMMLTTALQKEFGVEGVRTPGEVLAEADRLYKRYAEDSRRRPRDREKRAAWQDELNKLLVAIRDRYTEAIGLIEKSNSMDRGMRADYLAKSWYQVGLANLYLKDYYPSYVANQYVLQHFRFKKYPAGRYAGVDRYRRYAAKNVVAAAYRQRKRTKGKAPFDGKLYAWSLIWKLSYEAERPQEEDGAVGQGSIKEFYIAVGKEFMRIQRYQDAYEWFSRGTPDSKYYKLSYLMRAQAAMKVAERYEREVKRREADAKLAHERGEEGAAELKALVEAARAESQRYFARSVADANRYVEMVEANVKEYPDLDKLPAELEYKRAIWQQERNALFAGWLIQMTAKFNAGDYAAVREMASSFEQAKITGEKAHETKIKAYFMIFISMVQAVDPEKDEVDAVLKAYQRGEEWERKIAKATEVALEDDPEGTETKPSLQAPLVLGDGYLKLARRVEESDPQKYEELRLAAGRQFKKATSVVEKNLPFALMVGRIFSDMELHKEAEEIYTKALNVWDTEEKAEAFGMPSKKVAEKAVADAARFYFVHGGQDKSEDMKTLHEELVAAAYGSKTDKPNYYLAVMKLNAIRVKHREVVNELPEDELLAQGVVTRDFLADLRKAMDYRYQILTAKRNMVLAKVDMGQWDESLRLLEELLAKNPNEPEFLLLKGIVLVKRADQAESFDAQAQEDTAMAKNIAGQLTTRRPKKGAPQPFGYGTRRWWDALALNYQAEVPELLAKKDGGPEMQNKGAKVMKHIMMWQKNKKTKENFKEKTKVVYERLAEAGYVELGLDPETIEKNRKAAAEREKKRLEMVAQRNEKVKSERKNKMRQLREWDDKAQVRKFFSDLEKDNPDEYRAFMEEYGDQIKKMLAK